MDNGVLTGESGQSLRQPVRLTSPFTQGRLETADLADAFRESLRPFGLDEFAIGNEPDRIMEMKDGRVLGEFRTMLLPIWYPEKLVQLKVAGFEVVTVTKKYNTRPPAEMYYVRYVAEISGQGTVADALSGTARRPFPTGGRNGTGDPSPTRTKRKEE